MTDKPSLPQQCFAEKSISDCDATTMAMQAGIEWFRNPDPLTAGMDMGNEVYLTPKLGLADCLECARTCVVGFGIEMPESTKQLLHGPYIPTEKIRFSFVALMDSTF